MHADLTLLTQRLGTAVGGYRATAGATVADLAHPVDVVDAGLPVAQLELIFRSPHVASVAVRDPHDESRIGLVTRPRFTAAMTGRLGFGRAVLARRGTHELTDWGPMVVAPAAPVSEVAVRAMQRFDERRYDDVLVADESWRVVSTADLMRSLSTLLAVRSLHDALTGLPHRSMAMHELARRCADVAGTRSRVVVVLLDVVGFSRLNSAYGQGVGDVVLAGIGARLTGGLPAGWQAARTAGDEFAVVATLPAAASDEHATALADGLRRDVVALLAAPQSGIDPRAWPSLHSAVVSSGAGTADAERLFGAAQRGLRAAKESASVGEGLAEELRAILTGDVEISDI
ncbi:diguanylate cyclase domain-containing protein [uncultured Cellulomonas sp.]|uniref:GGDEF domain-containing protein n=1 Tax=uncultured Cellulomonas sp. TaxID=189682 RepID=UPI0028E4AF28|nr:diguanylate cyclase [uncultured Cellulomonas sp.]